LKRFRITNKKTRKTTLHKHPVDVSVRLVAFGNNPKNYIVEKLLDNNTWVVVDLKGKEMYQIEKELKEK